MDDVEAKVLEWLKNGNDTAQDIVDLPWALQEVQPNTYLAEHPRMPFSLMVVFSEGFVHLIVPLGLDTFSMSNNEKLKVYHTLLRLNDQVNMMKFTLSGMNDEVYLRVDLDKKTLGKEEFNDALTALLIGLLSSVSALGLEEAFEQEVFDRIVGMVVERMQNGASREELMRFLTIKVGMSVEDATALLEEVFKAKRSMEGSGDDVGYF
ncbi:DNA-binding protein [Thermococcus pacificus]|uniref:DNA-binding protein n=1 Tax=Thermococcus pacificus TaxID=71998 RepID=A0A218P615_9EURY|nr:DNA-binding protein [Thermococcus pacificus]ASJ06191.1 DNA-binding protein [Thermococcus pacificus]